MATARWVSLGPLLQRYQTRSRGAQCYRNCPPPTGLVTHDSTYRRLEERWSSAVWESSDVGSDPLEMTHRYPSRKLRPPAWFTPPPKQVRQLTTGHLHPGRRTGLGNWGLNVDFIFDLLSGYRIAFSRTGLIFAVTMSFSLAPPWR